MRDSILDGARGISTLPPRLPIDAATAYDKRRDSVCRRGLRPDRSKFENDLRASYKGCRWVFFYRIASNELPQSRQIGLA